MGNDGHEEDRRGLDEVGSDGGRPPFELRAGPFAQRELTVVSFTGRESISSLFSFEVVFLAKAPLNELAPLLLCQPATLVVAAPVAPRRIVQGIAAELELLGVRRARGDDLREYRVRIVPRMWLLRRKKNSRIFQDATVADVVNAVLDDAQIPRRWSTTGPFAHRSYCLQYEETDYAFIRRLCAEDGIYFYFEQPAALLDEATAGLGEAVAADVGAVGSLVGGVVGDTTNALTGAAKTVETVVFGTDATGYAPLSNDGATEIAAGAIAGVAHELSSISPEAGSFLSHARLPAASLPYVETKEGMVGGVEAVHAFSLRRAVRATKIELRDYDFQRPMLRVIGRTGGDSHDVAGSILDAAGDIAGAALDGGFDPSAIKSAASSELEKLGEPTLEVYDHRGDYEEPDASNAVAEVHLEQHRADASIGRGGSSCRRIAPGTRFALAEHLEEELNQEYVITEARHVGRTPWTVDAIDKATYENTFRCAPAYVSCRPKRRRHRVQQVLETAVVSGPPGSEVHTDAFGRVKVQFYWQRDGKRDTHSSCWIRVSQPWAGASWGHQFIPRVGMEVLVSFVGGDVDRPMILGASYNGTHPVPFALPMEKTRSGIRTRSSPGGDGFNELSFEDQAAREQIFLHAQRDLDEVVRRDHTLAVGLDETIRVAGSRRDSVTKNELHEVGGQRDETVQGDVTIRHAGARLDVIEKALDRRVGGARTTRLEDADQLEVRGAADHRYLTDSTTRVLGNHTLVVGKHEAPRSLTLRVEGVGAFSCEDVLELSSNKGVTLRCGKTTLRIGKDGIELSGGMIRAAGEKGGLEAGKDGLKMTSDKVYAHFGDQLLFKTESASVSMGNDVKIDGQKILLNSPGGGSDGPPPNRAPPTGIELKDTDGSPLANQRFVIELDDGSQRSGTTDKDGKAALDLPSGGKIRFPDVSNVKKG